VIRLAAVTVLAGLAVLAGSLSGAPRQSGAATPEQPSFVVIQTDDQTIDSLYAAHENPFGTMTRVMPNTLDLIGKRGITFDRYYVPYPLCCPARVSLLTGRYAHNHNVRGNNNPNAGYVGFSYRGAAQHNLATWLQRDGYRTIHIGKFLNGYGDPPYDDGTSFPPGWSTWYGVPRADTQHLAYGYRINHDGAMAGPFGDPGNWETREWGVRDDPGCPYAPANFLPCYHLTDTLSRIASQELLATPPERPFYLQLDYMGPHGDFRRPAGPEPAPRHYDWFAETGFPHGYSQGLNEGNVGDKPSFIRDAPFLTPRELRTYRIYYEKQQEALRAIDDGVKLVIDTLGGMGRLRNTYILFVSDNGFFFGEHRLLGGKFLAYEPATHMPLLMRGPGIKPGSRTGELMANVDVAPTLLELAGAEADKSIDGRSMVPFIRDRGLRTRRPILFESFVETSDVNPSSVQRPAATASIAAPPKDYAGLRHGPWKYIAWPTGEKELYNITRDPYELNSLHKVPNFFPIRNFLDRWMRHFVDCVGRECRVVTPQIPLTRKEQQRLRRKKERERRQRERERERREKERERDRR
jgi:arylsulfatase A-like enzyme